MIFTLTVVQLLIRRELSKCIQWNPSTTDTNGTKNFVLYSKVLFAQRVIVDHAPHTVVACDAGARLWTMKSVVLIKCLLIFSP